MQEVEQITRKLEKVIHSYIPKHQTCRFEEQKREMVRGKEKERILETFKKHEMGPELTYTNQWQEQAPDMSVCATCREAIYGTQYELKHYLNGEEIEQERPVKVCEPCYLKMEK